jgi:hypothetical protein
MRAMRERKPVHGAFHLHSLDGTLHPIEASAIPVESAAGRVVGALIFLWPRAPGADGPESGDP